MEESVDIAAKLAKLTPRQCQILYWVCRAKSYPWIAKKINWGKDLVQAEMLEVYDILELGHLVRDERRDELRRTICPIHLKQVGEDGKGCTNPSVGGGIPVPVEENTDGKIPNLEQGLIPSQPTLPANWVAPLIDPTTEPNPPIDVEESPHPNPPDLDNRRLKLLVGLLLVIVVGIGGVEFYRLFGGKTGDPGPPTGQTVIVITAPPVIITLPPVATTASQSAPTPVSQATLTSTPVPQATPTSTTIPSPAPTRSLDTPAGTVLEIGQRWRQDNVVLAATDNVFVPDSPYPCRVSVAFRLDNLSSSSIIVGPHPSQFSMQDNLGRPWQTTGISVHGGSTCPDAVPSSLTFYSHEVKSGETYDNQGWYIGFKGNLADPALTDVIVTVSGLYHFEGAKWKIHINH